MGNTERKFKIGDVVELNSGGPKMTVIKLVLGQYLLDCEYFQDGGFIVKRLHEDAITKVIHQTFDGN